MKKNYLFALFVVVLLLSGCSNSSENVPEKIGIIQLVDHSSLNTIRDSIILELEENGYTEDDIVYINCSGDMSNVNTAVSTMQGNNTSVVIAITTPVAQACFNLAKVKPIIFSAVTDPISAGLLDDLNNPNNNITGTSDAVSISGIIDLALEFDKDIETVGFIYNPSESNSVSNLSKLKDYCSTKDIEVVESTIYTSANLKLATTTISDKCDIIFVSNDNTVAEGMQILANTAIDLNKMVFVGADSMVSDGGLATLGIDYTELGKETARQAIQVLNGKDVSEIPVTVFDTNLNIYVNIDTAKALDIVIPEDVLNNEKYIAIKN